MVRGSGVLRSGPLDFVGDKRRGSFFSLDSVSLGQTNPYIVCRSPVKFATADYLVILNSF